MAWLLSEKFDFESKQCFRTNFTCFPQDYNICFVQSCNLQTSLHKSLFVTDTVWNSKIFRTIQHLNDQTLYCHVCCDVSSEPKFLAIPFDYVTQFRHFYCVYYERYEENILPRGNILLSDDEILIPITYTHLPYDIKNPILQFWTFLVGGEKFLDLSNLAMKELVTGACKRHNICALNLSRNKLQYLSPRRFTRLKKLNIITLDYNQFTTFPSVLISLTTLTRLSLSHNAITRIPNEISQLKNLKILRVEFNRLQELPQTMSCLVQLEELALSGNQWKNTASIWTTLCSLPSLECLLLAQSQVSEIPTNISLLTKLKILDCSVNRITLLPDSLGMLKELQILRLGHNRIKQIPTGITKLQHLLHLELNNNEIESISLTLWNALSKRATLILEHNPLPLNFVRHRKVNLKSSADTSSPLVQRVRDSNLKSLSQKDMKSHDTPWDRTLRSFSSPVMSSPPSSTNRKDEDEDEEKHSQTSTPVTQQPQVVVTNYSQTKKNEPTAVSISQPTETDSDETSNTTEGSQSLSSTKTSVESVETSATSATTGKINPFVRRGRSKKHKKHRSDKSHESPRVMDSTSEHQTSISIDSSPSTTPFSSPRGSCNFRDMSQTHFDLDDIDSEVILGSDSTNNSIMKLQSKSKSKSKSTQKHKTKEKKESHTPHKKMSKSKSTAALPKKTKITTNNKSNKSEHDDNREMSLLEFIREEPPPPPSKKNDSSGHTRIKRALSTSIITRLHTLSKKDKKQNENTEKRDKKDKKKHRTKDKEKETKESNKRLAPSLAQIGKSSTIADIKKVSQPVELNENHTKNETPTSTPSKTKHLLSPTSSSNVRSLRRGTISTEKVPQSLFETTTKIQKRVESTEEAPSFETSKNKSSSNSPKVLKSSATVGSLSFSTSQNTEQASTSTKHSSRNEPNKTNLESLISPRRTTKHSDRHSHALTDMPTHFTSNKTSLERFSHSSMASDFTGTSKIRQFNSVRLRSKQQIESLSHLKADVKLSPFTPRKRKSVKYLHRTDIWSLPSIKEKSFIDFLVPDSKVLRIQHRPEGSTVVAVTAEALIELLTHEKGEDERIENTFILTFPTIMTPSKLFELLIQRYHSISKDDDQDKSVVVKERVLNVIERVLETHPHILKDTQTKSILTKFIVDMNTSGVDPLKFQEFKQRLKLFGGAQQNQIPLPFSHYQYDLKMPLPILPVNVHAESMDLLDLHPEEVARQLTLIEFNLFAKIEVCEWLQAKNINNETAPNISALIQRFNEVSRWVSSSIVLVENLDLRVVVMNRFILIACKCFELHNFNGVMEIMSGLAEKPVERLNQTWSNLPPKTIHRYNQLNEITSMDGNFKALRELMNELKPPCIPFLGLYLRDFVFALDGNPERTDDGLINFEKLTLLGNLITKLREFQRVPYQLHPIEIIQDYLTQNLAHLPDELLEAQSYKIEPRKG